MTQFFAILRDSFREAVDGFVIYAMLGLTAIVLLLIGSLSFKPAPAEEVIPNLVKQFALYIPDRGTAKPAALDLGTTYTATEIKTSGRDVSFRLTAKGEGFRRSVAGWLKPAGPAEKVQFGPNTPRRGGKGKEQHPNEEPDELGLEFVRDQGVTATEAAAVTDDQMVAFVANQFQTHLGTRKATAKLAQGSTETTHEFEVVVPGATSAPDWPQDVALFFGGWKFDRFPLGVVIQVAEDNIVNGIGAWVTLLIGVVITAFFIPNMLRKGALDLLIAKPIGRSQLLIYKYIGGLTFMFLLSVAAIGGAWLVLALRSGHWDPHFLLVIPLLTFTFALLYAVSTLTAVFTRSAIAAILITLTFAIMLGLVGHFKTIADQKRNTGVPIMGNWPEWMYTLADTLNDVLPRYKDLDKLSSKITAEGNLTPLELRALTGRLEYPSWSGAVGLSLAYIAAMLALACWRFKRRDS